MRLTVQKYDLFTLYCCLLCLLFHYFLLTVTWFIRPVQLKILLTLIEHVWQWKKEYEPTHLKSIKPKPSKSKSELVSCGQSTTEDSSKVSSPVSIIWIINSKGWKDDRTQCGAAKPLWTGSPAGDTCRPLLFMAVKMVNYRLAWAQMTWSRARHKLQNL